MLRRSFLKTLLASAMIAVGVVTETIAKPEKPWGDQPTWWKNSVWTYKKEPIKLWDCQKVILNERV